MESILFNPIKQKIADLNIDGVSKERKQVLLPLISFIQEKVTTNEEVRLNFICTHNSRRSHLSQVWAQTMAAYYNIPNVYCYSGGTEATAVFPKIVETLELTGFEIVSISHDKNPVYALKFEENHNPIIAFSKKYDHAYNPKNGFAAIMTCSSADVGCPFVSGAELRVPITFEDPKAFDNTPLQNEKYMERSIEIATELSYIFSQIKL